jgi:hypothetical protein
MKPYVYAALALPSITTADVEISAYAKVCHMSYVICHTRTLYAYMSYVICHTQLHMYGTQTPYPHTHIHTPSYTPLYPPIPLYH